VSLLATKEATIEGPVTLVLVGIGGMGGVYVRELLRREGEGLFRIAGAVDPQPNRCEQYRELRALGVPCFVGLADFYRNKRAELAVISSPIQFHREQTCLALENGSHVLCEKPAAGTVQEVRDMATAEAGSGRRAAVGYQWSYSRAVQALKSDIRAGLFGRPKRMRCLYLWPRDEGYYARNDWAGSKRAAGGSGWVLDSPAQNAMAHDLHNMFYVLGSETDRSAMPAEVEAELYRAYPVENFDTAAARAVTGEGVEVLFYVTHVAEAERGPVFLYEFEKAVVKCESRASGIWAELADGSRKDYGVPDDESMAKLWRSVAGVRDGTRPLCGLEAAAAQTLCVNGMQDSLPEIREFPERMVRSVGEEGARRLVVEGLGEAFEKCFEAGALPSELGIGWSAKGKRIDLRDYRSFPSG
jgi:predicted dehydrogenase